MVALFCHVAGASNVTGLFSLNQMLLELGDEGGQHALGADIVVAYIRLRCFVNLCHTLWHRFLHKEKEDPQHGEAHLDMPEVLELGDEGGYHALAHVACYQLSVHTSHHGLMSCNVPGFGGAADSVVFCHIAGVANVTGLRFTGVSVTFFRGILYQLCQSLLQYFLQLHLFRVLPLYELYHPYPWEPLSTSFLPAAHL